MSSSIGVAIDDLVQPFQIEGLGIRGRVVRLGPLVDRVLTSHAYPEPVSRLLGEALALTAMIGSALKFDGRFILQTQGDGPVSMLVADYEAPGKIRGYAMMNAERVAEAIEAGRTEPADLMGSGHLALTIDQGPDMAPYQGIVALHPDGLSHSAHEYFANSEQVATRIRLAAGPFYHREETGPEKNWRAGAIMIQHIARDGGLTGYREGDDDERPYTDEEEAWNRASILLATVEDHELLDPEIEPTRLLFRLFHEDGVRAYDPSPVEFSCHCSRDRMSSVLRSFGGHEIDEMAQEGIITVTCEFCSEVYIFEPAELKEGLN
ncbi:Hsp33 family molecular chaperone [Parvibaculum sp.]|uniref:Hsp33 family molecular chaperone n=1 Tax=Parvibaculum sp. TaxID=2024848 RepID=UPI0032999E9F